MLLDRTTCYFEDCRSVVCISLGLRLLMESQGCGAKLLRGWATIFDIFGSWNFVHIRKLLQNGLQGRIFGPWHRWEQMMFQLILPRTIPGHWSPVANRLRPVTALQYSLRPSCIPPQSHLLKGFLTEASRVLRNWLSTKSGLKFSNLEGSKSVTANLELMSAELVWQKYTEMELNGSTQPLKILEFLSMVLQSGPSHISSDWCVAVVMMAVMRPESKI